MILIKNAGLYCKKQHISNIYNLIASASKTLFLIPASLKHLKIRLFTLT